MCPPPSLNHSNSYFVKFTLSSCCYFFFFLGPTSLMSRVRSVAPQLACCKILFLRFNKILVAAILGNLRAFKVTFHVLRFFGLFVSDPWVGNAANGLERDISVITKVQRTWHIASTVAPAFSFSSKTYCYSENPYHDGIWRLVGRT